MEILDLLLGKKENDRLGRERIEDSQLFIKECEARLSVII